MKRKLYIFLLPLFFLTSCFTGVEGTKRIGMSRDDRKALAVSPEEAFFGRVAPEPLSAWQKGKAFVAADDKTLLIFDQRGLPANIEQVSLGGKVLLFDGEETIPGPDGGNYCVVRFRTPDGLTLRYMTGIPASEASGKLMSDAIPMMIDYDMVLNARTLLDGRKLWIKSSLWYDSKGERVEGRKYVPVTITGIVPGNIAFPMMVAFADGTGEEKWAYMNFGHSQRDTRSFATLFSMNNLREKYSSITDSNWELITRGKVAVGMTKEECKLSLGSPKDVEAGRDYSQTIDLWQYPDGAVLWFEGGLLTRFRM